MAPDVTRHQVTGPGAAAGCRRDGFLRGGHAGYGVAVGWPEDPGSLLAGPRGRRLCWSLAAGLSQHHQARIGPAWEQVISLDRLGVGPAELAGELAAAVARRDWPAVVAGMSEAELAGPLAESAGWAMYWQPPDGVDQALAYPEVAEALRPVADAVTGAPAAEWWPGGLDLGAQQYVQPAGNSRGRPGVVRRGGPACRLAGRRSCR